MATLKGSTIASTFDSLVKRADTYSQTGTNIELMTDTDATVAPTGLYLESGAVTDNVGIGITAPTAKLHIEGANAIKVYETGSDYQYHETGLDLAYLSTNATIDDGFGPSIAFSIKDSGGTLSQIGMIGCVRDTADTKGKLIFGTYDTGTQNFNTTHQRMVIDNTGNVGIGTATPDHNLEIQALNATAQIDITTYDNGALYPVLEFRKSDQDTEGLAQTDDGDALGQIRFKGVDSGSNLDTGAHIYVEQSGSASTRVPTLMRLETYSSSAQNTNQLVLAANGNVGIGVAAPDSLLHIEGALNESAYSLHLQKDGTSSSFMIKLENEDASGTTAPTFELNHMDSGDFHIGKAYNDAYFTIQDTGNVGIGITAPVANLHVKNTADTNSDVPVLLVETAEAALDASEEIVRISGLNANIHGISARLIAIHDSGGEIGYLTTASDGNINTAWTNVSDKRLKKDIKDTSLEGLKIINGIKVRDFKWNDKRKNVENMQVIGGFVADELYEVYPYATNGNPNLIKDDGSIDAMGVTQGNLISLMVKAVQELSAKVTALENA